MSKSVIASLHPSLTANNFLIYFSALKDRSRVAVVTANVAKIVTKLKQPDIGICPT